MMDARRVIGNLCGFLTVICGVFLLNAFRNLPITFSDAFAAGHRKDSDAEYHEMDTLLPSHRNRISKPIY